MAAVDFGAAYASQNAADSIVSSSAFVSHNGAMSGMVPFNGPPPSLLSDQKDRQSSATTLYSTSTPEVVSMDAARGCCTLSVTLTRTADGYGFKLSQFSLYEAQKNSNKAINLEPLARKCRFAKDGGLPIVDIVPHGPAAQAGARQWDVITEINSTDIRGLVAKDAIAMTKSTDRLELKICRQGPPPSNAQTVGLAASTYGSLYGSMAQSPFVTNSVPPLERVKNTDGSVQLKLQLNRQPSAEWGFTPFKYSITDLKNKKRWTNPFKTEYDLDTLKKKCKFAKEIGGIAIQCVRLGTPAQISGINPWDVITEINGTSIRESTAEQITELFRGAGESVVMTIYRSANPPSSFTLSANGLSHNKD